MATTLAGLDLTSVQEWAAHYRPVLEVVGLIWVSALIGYLTARWVYRAKVSSRNDLLRLEQTRARRRASQSAVLTGSLTRERDRWQRRMRQSRAGSAAPRGPAGTPAPGG